MRNGALHFGLFGVGMSSSVVLCFVGVDRFCVFCVFCVFEGFFDSSFFEGFTGFSVFEGFIGFSIFDGFTGFSVFEGLADSSAFDDSTASATPEDSTDSSTLDDSTASSLFDDSAEIDALTGVEDSATLEDSSFTLTAGVTSPDLGISLSLSDKLDSIHRRKQQRKRSVDLRERPADRWERVELRFAPRVFLVDVERFIFTEKRREDCWESTLAEEGSVESVWLTVACEERVAWVSGQMELHRLHRVTDDGLV